MSTRNRHVKILSHIWKSLQGCLAPGQSPLASFLEHPKFQKAAGCSSFQAWIEKGLTQFYKLGKDATMYSTEQIFQLLGNLPIIRF